MMFWPSLSFSFSFLCWTSSAAGFVAWPSAGSTFTCEDVGAITASRGEAKHAVNDLLKGYTRQSTITVDPVEGRSERDVFGKVMSVWCCCGPRSCSPFGRLLWLASWLGLLLGPPSRVRTLVPSPQVEVRQSTRRNDLLKGYTRQSTITGDPSEGRIGGDRAVASLGKVMSMWVSFWLSFLFL